jgi:uncharacterized protein (TIGR00730 family)
VRFVRVCVFCGSSAGRGETYVHAARSLGRLLAGRGIDVVYGGARVGTMGELANAALDSGGTVTGVIPQHLVDKEIPHTGLTELYVVRDMHERKAKMAELANAFIALPGGAGTLEELAEVWTWAQLGLHAKPIGLLDIGGFYRPFREFIDHMVTERFLRPRHRDMLLIDAEPRRLLDRFAEYTPPPEKYGVETLDGAEAFDGAAPGPAWPGSQTAP